MNQAASWLLHISLGTFFACSGYNKLTNGPRHKALVETLTKDKVPAIAFNQWWVPGWEVVAGFALATGIAPRLAACVLLVIMLVAILVEGKEKVKLYSPINGADCLADWLYLPEVLYSIILASIAMGV